MNPSTQQTLAELLKIHGYSLPPVTAPAANYVATQKTGNLLYVSGQISCNASGAADFFGRVGEKIGVDEAYRAAQSCALSVLAQLNAVVQGDANQIRQVLRLGVFVAAASDFTAHSQVANGASDLMVEVLGEKGRHVRTAVGVASLPRGVVVEVDALIELAE
jgi:enamine deaminase RidA (YjgF/YER057c/UK114 family)